MALDVANSVILRHDPARSLDRFADPRQLESFADAAQVFCAERALFGDVVPVPDDCRSRFLDLREAIDGYFRACVQDVETNHLLAALLEAIAGTLRRTNGNSLDAATAHSALRLLAADQVQRLKICRNCGWLFIDRSKNRSRRWCDMAVCGNRAKASRHYHRTKEKSA